MRPKSYLVCIVVVVGSLSLSVGGCQKEEPKAPVPTVSEKTKEVVPPVVTNAVESKLPSDLALLQAEAERGRASLDVVMASLDTVIASADADPKAAFGKLTKDLSALEAQVKVVRSRSDAMKSKGAAYFKTWETQLGAIATPEIRQAAEKRRDEITKDYDSILASMAKSREAYDQIFSTLKDFEKILANDLNPQGIKAMAPKVGPVKAQVKTLTADVASILGSLKKIASVYSPGR